MTWLIKPNQLLSQAYGFPFPVLILMFRNVKQDGQSCQIETCDGQTVQHLFSEANITANLSYGQ